MQWFEHYSVFEPVFPDDTCAATSGCYQPEVFSCTPTQKIDSPHSQRYWIASKASNIEITTNQNMHNTTTPVNPKRYHG